MMSAVDTILRRNPLLFRSYHFARTAWELAPKKIAYKVSQAGRARQGAVDEAVASLRRDGLVVLPAYLPARLVDEMSKAVEDAFATGQYVYGPGIFASEKALTESERSKLGRLAVLDPTLRTRAFVEFALDAFIVNVVQAYLGIQIMLAGIAAYRTQPSVDSANGAFLWHYDNAVCQLKAICYLTPVVGETHGPLAVVKGSHRGRGLAATYEETRIDPQLADGKADLCLGPEGTVVIIDTLATHRATPVKQEYRDVVSAIYDGGTRGRRHAFYNLPIPTGFLRGLTAEQREILRVPRFPGQIGD